MQSYLVVQRYIDDDSHLFELRFIASNGSFTGDIFLYCGLDDIQRIAAGLKDFPKKIGDEFRYENGSEDPGSYKYFLLRAYTVDSVGHCALQVAMNLNTAEPDEGACRFSIRVDPEGLARLGRLFEQFVEPQYLELRWDVSGGELFADYQSH
jgi:hypothetical protein